MVDGSVLKELFDVARPSQPVYKEVHATAAVAEKDLEVAKKVDVQYPAVPRGHFGVVGSPHPLLVHARLPIPGTVVTNS